MPVIAAIILFSVIFLIDYPYFKSLFIGNKGKLIGYSITLLATLFVGFSQGILFGFLFSFILKKSSSPLIRSKGIDS